MKIAKDYKNYIEETSPGSQRETSLAEWLSPERLSDPCYAQHARKYIETTTDKEFELAFGRTRDEAARLFERWELCQMERWGATELARAIILCNAGRDEALVLRAVSMAQSEKELPDIFSPMKGIQWAMSKEYLIARNILAWCGIPPSYYGGKYHPLSEAAAPAAKVKAGTDTSPGDDWTEQARAIADECFDTDTKGGCRDSLARRNGRKIVGGYSFRVMELMQERGIKGARGIIDNPATIMREALQGEKWWANKSK